MSIFKTRLRREWKIKNRRPDEFGTDDCYVRLIDGVLEIHHGEDDPSAIDFTYDEAVELAAVFKAAVHNWRKIGVV